MKISKNKTEWYSNTTNYDYPWCGGKRIIIKLWHDINLGKKCTVQEEKCSNYQGKIDGRKTLTDYSTTELHAVCIASALGLLNINGDAYEDPTDYYHTIKIHNSPYKFLAHGHVVR